MRNALALTVLAGAMTFGFSTSANAVELSKPSTGANCVTVGEGRVVVTPDGGVHIQGNDVTVAPLTSCI